MINQMSSSMRNFMEAYSAVHNKEAKEEFYSHKDEISEMDFSLINQTELNDIAEEVLEELFEEGYSVEQCEAIFEEVLTEARVTYGSDTESPRAKKMFAMESSLKGAIGKVKENAASGAVKSYGAYRSAKQAKANRLKEGASYVTAQTQRDAIKAKAKVRDGMKGMIGEAAKKVGDAANKVSSRMSEGTVRKDVGDIYQAIYEKKAAKDYDGDGEVESGKDEYFGSKDNAIKKAMGKKGKCEKCGKDPCECDKKEVEEGYKELPKNKMFRKAGNLGRDAISTPIDPEKRQKAYDRSKKIVKTLNKANEEVQQVDEAITSEKGKAKMKSMIDARTTDSGRAKPGKGQNVKDIKHIGRANVDGYGGTPPNLKVAKNPVKSNFTGLNSGTGNKAAKRAAALKKEEVTFSESELEAIQAKVDAWDVEEGYQRNPEKGEAEARKSQTAETKVRHRLKTMDPKKAEAMKKQMRAVGLNV